LSVGSERPRRPVAGASASLLLAISSMATARHAVRSAYLAPHFDVSTLPVQPMWDVFAVFAVLLVVGLGVVAWMLRKLFGPTTAGTTKIAT
jgi:hypothetical protein